VSEASEPATDRVAVITQDEQPELSIVEGEGFARALAWPGVGARLRAMHRIVLGAGSSTVELRHPGEAAYAVVAGAGEVRDEDGGDVQPLETGSMVHVDPGTPHRLVAGAGGMDVVGGPGPVDPSLYDVREVT
jgi:quercetin dioxygenase-like cupin family protein